MLSKDWHQNYSENRKDLWLGQETKGLKSRAPATSKASGKWVKLVHSKLGEKWMVLKPAAVDERGEREARGGGPSGESWSKSSTATMRTLVHPWASHQTWREIYWETRENTERLGRIILTSKIIPLSGEQGTEKPAWTQGSTMKWLDITKNIKLIRKKKKWKLSRTKISKIQYWTI